jgi:hypothetical protein
MTTTSQNPAGVEPHDHSAIAGLPEYHQLADAMQAFVQAVTQADVELPQDQWLVTVRQAAAALAFMDACRTCDDLDAHPAYRVEIAGDELTGTYICGRGHRWKCHWSVELAGVLGVFG